jgi:hypothetical protein
MFWKLKAIYNQYVSVEDLKTTRCLFSHKIPRCLKTTVEDQGEVLVQ